MKRERPIVLVIVEGSSDEAALFDHLEAIVLVFDVRFEVLHGDVLTDMHNTNKTAKNIIGAIVADYKNKRKLGDDDILAVIQLTDTDGVFIPETSVLFDSTLEKRLKYTCEEIIVSDKKRQNLIIQRNGFKSKKLLALSRTKKINKAVFYIYYFSRNLDAIIHNNADLSDSEKITAAEEFSDSFANEIEFEQFFHNKDFAVVGDYQKSWNFITQGCNSLNRYSNFHLLFASLRSLFEEHRRSE